MTLIDLTYVSIKKKEIKMFDQQPIKKRTLSLSFICLNFGLF